MKVVFVSNFMNHHQYPFSVEMQNLLGDNYKFIATSPTYNEKLRLGYDDMNKKFPFVLTTYDSDENMQKALDLIYESDVVIMGSAPEKMIRKRILSKKLTFRYSERLFKRGNSLLKYIPMLIKFRFLLPYNNSTYMLCASAYTAADYKKFCMYKNHTYKWGYFPEIKKYENIDEIIDKKHKNSIMWAGRMIDWKHPELAVLVAKKLKNNGYDFTLNMVGTGYMEDSLKEMVAKENLDSCVHILGSMSPEKVREYMEKSQIYLFTSNFQEGWGAVLNEAMNSGCVTIASHAIGSVPFVLEDGKNGLIYKNDDFEDLYRKIVSILDNPKKCDELGKNAYKTMLDCWNAEVAANRFLSLANSLLNNVPVEFNSGPCSKAEIIKNDWYK